MQCLSGAIPSFDLSAFSEAVDLNAHKSKNFYYSRCTTGCLKFVPVQRGFGRAFLFPPSRIRTKKPPSIPSAQRGQRRPREAYPPQQKIGEIFHRFLLTSIKISILVLWYLTQHKYRSKGSRYGNVACGFPFLSVLCMLDSCLICRTLYIYPLLCEGHGPQPPSRRPLLPNH